MPRALLLASLTLTAGAAFASHADSGADAGDMRDLLALLDEQTDLATREGMNADFVPGMATILHGDELLLRGAHSVWEALSLVPGINLGLEMTGERQVLSRGVGYSGYTSGNIKILLNGISMNSAVMATANAVLNLPVEQIERIEVIRGPGASVHGEYAYAGVVNVITRQHDRRLHAQVGEGGRHGLGGVWYWEDPERDLRFSINLAGLEGRDGADVERDALYVTGNQRLSHAPGRSNEATRFGSLFMHLDWGDTQAAIQLLRDRYGDHFGMHHFLPPDDGRLATDQQFWTVWLGHDLTFSERLRASLRLEAWRHERESDLYLFPAGYRMSSRMPPLANPLYVQQEYGEDRYQLSADLHWQPHERHRLLFGLEFGQAMLFEPIPNWRDTSRNRKIYSALVQDQFRLNDRVDLTATLRVDDYSDIGTFVSPRLAGVWRLDDRNILKAQYARAFRPPTFFDLEYAVPGTSIEASIISTYELGYILKQPRWEIRGIVFHSDLEQPVILPFGGIGFTNDADVRLRGIELEYSLRVTPSLKLDATASWVDSERQDNGRDLEGGAGFLANLALLWQPAAGWTATLQAQHVGERARANYDSREPLGAYTTLDLSLQYRRASSGPYAVLGVENLADTEFAYPDLAFMGPSRQYPDGYPRPGRRWWLSVGYAF